ncbi:MAG: hypothetical protein NVSMB12_14760 [Acidimicrobiales bacterium]
MLVRVTRAGRRWPLSVVGALLLATGCGVRAPAGLGIKACPYVRPRLVRIDRDILQSLPADLGGVAQDFDLYVRQLPDGGRARADRQLVRFAAALRAASESGSSPPDLSALAPAESALKARCKVRT